MLDPDTEATRCQEHAVSVIRDALVKAWPKIAKAMLDRDDAGNPVSIPISLKLSHTPGKLVEASALATVTVRDKFESECALDLAQLDLPGIDTPKPRR